MRLGLLFAYFVIFHLAHPSYQAIGCELRRRGVSVNAGLQRVRQAPGAQCFAARRVVTPTPSLRRDNVLKPRIAVRFIN